MINLEFDVRESQTAHEHTDIELFYVVNGRLNVSVEDNNYLLLKDDFVVINSRKRHRYSADDAILLACFRIDYEKLCELMGQQEIAFNCSSLLVGNESGIRELRKNVREALDSFSASRGRNVMQLQVLYYKMLQTLTAYFMTIDQNSASADMSSPENRKREIERFINENYEHQLRLSDLADQLHLSVAYLSKYIKREFGMGFLEYVNRVRLRHAVTELIYSEKSVARISMDMGFANLTAFNRLFKETYQKTPSVFRREYRSEHQPLENVSKGTEDEDYEVSTSVQEMPENKVLHQSVQVTNDRKRLFEKHWNRMINAGDPMKLLESDAREHLLSICRVFGFSVVRLCLGTVLLSKDDLNAFLLQLDKCLEMLERESLTPYIAIPIVDAKEPQSTAARYSDDLREIIENAMTHWVNRFGMRAVSEWTVELIALNAGENDDDELAMAHAADLYLHCFSLAAKIMRRFIPGMSIGGGSFPLSVNTGPLEQIVDRWITDNELPSFISCSYVPEEGTEIGRPYEQTPLYRRLTYTRRAMEKHGFSNVDLHVSTWQLSVRRQNVNDTCFAGAYYMKNVLAAADSVKMIGYGLCSDVFDPDSENGTLLDGIPGLISRDGIPKPIYYAAKFMNGLGRNLYLQGENYAVTDDGFGNWQIICHNYKDLNYHYYTGREQSVDYLNQDIMLADTLKLNLHFNLPIEGPYRFSVHTYAVNRSCGSVLDAWNRMGSPKLLNREDVDYLKSVCVPCIKVSEMSGESDKLELETLLEPNEIQLIVMNRIM